MVWQDFHRGGLLCPKASVSADSPGCSFLLILQQGASLEAIYKTPFTAITTPQKSIPNAHSHQQTCVEGLPSVVYSAVFLGVQCSGAVGDAGKNEMKTLSQGAAWETGRGEAGGETVNHSECVCKGVNEGPGTVLSSPVARSHKWQLNIARCWACKIMYKDMYNTPHV